MTAFILIGALMVLAAFGLVVMPALKHAPAGRRLPTVLIAVVVIPVLATALYLTLGSREWSATPASAETPIKVLERVAGLEERMKTQPLDISGWVMLGRSYVQLKRYDRAVEAYQKAYTLSQGGNAEAVVGLGEAMILAEPNAMPGPVPELFDQALQLAPRHPKALWYGGLIAFQRGDLASAHARWTTLMSLNPPDAFRKVIQQGLAEIEAQVNAPAAGPSATGARIQVRVALAPALAGKIPRGASLFVLARPAGASGGPPLAVKKLSAAQLPVDVELTDQDAMIAGHTLSSTPRVTLIARISISGSPKPAAGDLEGRLEYSDGGQPAVVLIDSIVP